MKFKSKFFSYLIVGIFSYIGYVHGAPSVYINSSNQLKDIKNSLKARFIGDNKNSSIVYVLPPKFGAIELKNFKSSINLAFCEDLANLVKFSKARTRELNQLNERRQKILEEKLLVQNHTNEVVEQLNNLRSANPQLVEYETLKAEGGHEEEIKKFESKNRELVTNFNKLLQQKMAADVDFELLDQRLSQLEKRLVENKNTVDSLYEKYAKREGGFASFEYETGWDNQIEQLAAENPKYNFERIFTKNVKLYAKFIGYNDKATYEASLPAILDFVVNGERFSPDSDKAQVLGSMPTKISAHVRLSLAGACAMTNPDAFELKKSEAGIPLFGLVATYDYPSVFSANVKVTYNRHQIYRRIRREAEGTSIFTIRQAQKLIEDKDGWSDMKVEWVDDSEGAISAKSREEILKEIRKEILEEILQMMGVPLADEDQSDGWNSRGNNWWNNDTDSDVQWGRRHSSQELGNSWSQGCQFDQIFCFVGGFIIRGLNALFGGDKAEDHFFTKVKGQVTRQLTTTSTHMRSGVTSFAP